MYGGKFAFQNRLGQLVVKTKFTIFALFYFLFEGKFQVQVPRGAYIRRPILTEGFCVTILGDLYLEGIIHEGTYFRNFTVSAYLPGQYEISCRLCFFSLPVKKHKKLMPWNDLRTQAKMVLKCDDRFCPSKYKSGNEHQKKKTNSATRLASGKGTRHYSRVPGSATTGNRTGLRLGLQQFNLQLVNVNHTCMFNQNINRTSM